MRKLLFWTSLVSLITGVGVVGCSGGGSSGGGGGAAPTTGAVRVLITDAPLSDLTSVTVAAITVERIELHASNGAIQSGTGPTTSGTAPLPSSASPGNGNGNGRSNGNGNGNGGVAPTNSGVAPTSSGVAPNGSNVAGWHVVFDAATMGGAKTFNLLDLRGGINAELAIANLPAASYQTLRIEISAAEVVHNGNTYSTANGLLDITSGRLQLQLQNAAALTVNAGGMAELLIDVDLSRTFNFTGPATNPNRFQVLPTLRVADLSTSGSLAGVVRSDNGTPGDVGDDTPIANAAVEGTYNGVTVMALTDAQGVYVLPGLDAGDWDLSVTAPGHDAYQAVGITVTAGQQTTSDATLVKP